MKNRISLVNSNQTQIFDLRGNLVISNHYPFLKKGIIKSFPALKLLNKELSYFKELAMFSQVKFNSSEALVNPYYSLSTSTI